jgi:hypothetical protein
VLRDEARHLRDREDEDEIEEELERGDALLRRSGPLTAAGRAAQST